jgi:ATP-dependent RNA circularization protein (DNA/RNA ligase family)
MHYKYKKTMHLPFSLGLQNDDRRIEDESCFDGKTVAVTIKMDGENTSMYRDGLHARSLSSAHHPSRSVVKALHAQIKNDIPEGWRICGENMYAKHSIHYTDLESYFYVFSIWNEFNECFSLEKTLEICEDLGLTHVKVQDTIENFHGSSCWNLLEIIYHNVVADGHEGIVIRNVDSYHYDDFQKNLAKAVRKDHIQTSEHWMSQPVIPNLLKTNE